MKGLSFIPSGVTLNRIFKSSRYNTEKKVLVDSEEYLASVGVSVKASELRELTGQALAAQEEIMHALENLNKKLDNAEICV